MRFLKYILFPVQIIYSIIILVRNILYNKSLPYLILYNEINPDNKAGLNNLATIYYKLDMVKESQAIRKQLNSLK